MTVEERYAHANQLVEEEKYLDAVEEMEELARETGNIQIIFSSMALNNLVAKVRHEIGNQDGAIKNAERTIDWAIRLSEEEEIMNENREDILKKYSFAQSIKGRAIFCNDYSDASAVKPLEEAISYGDDEALFWLGYYYLMNQCEPSEDIDSFTESCSRVAEYHERYLDSLTQVDEPERIVRISENLAAYYENGVGVPKDLNKAAYYRNLANQYQ